MPYGGRPVVGIKLKRRAGCQAACSRYQSTGDVPGGRQPVVRTLSLIESVSGGSKLTSPGKRRSRCHLAVGFYSNQVAPIRQCQKKAKGHTSAEDEDMKEQKGVVRWKVKVLGHADGKSSR